MPITKKESRTKQCNKFYCGDSDILPEGYYRLGTRSECLRKGFGTGMYKEREKWEMKDDSDDDDDSDSDSDDDTFDTKNCEYYTVSELRLYAKKNNINLKGSTKKVDICKRIRKNAILQMKKN
jgi:hypothetical protein